MTAPPRIKDRVNVGLPSAQIVSVLKERRDPGSLADPVALEVTPEREEHLARLSRARARVQEREQELLLEADIRISIVPVERRYHVELRAPAIPRVAPGDERALALVAAAQHEQRIDEQERVVLVPVMKERQHRRVPLVVPP